MPADYKVRKLQTIQRVGVEMLVRHNNLSAVDEV